MCLMDRRIRPTDELNSKDNAGIKFTWSFNTLGNGPHNFRNSGIKCKARHKCCIEL